MLNSYMNVWFICEFCHSNRSSEYLSTMSFAVNCLKLSLPLPKVAQNLCQCPNSNKHIAFQLVPTVKTFESPPPPAVISCHINLQNGVARSGCCLPKVQVLLCIKGSLKQTQAPQTHFGPTPRKHTQCTR